jgi:hypothetical protein
VAQKLKVFVAPFQAQVRMVPNDEIGLFDKFMNREVKCVYRVVD